MLFLEPMVLLFGTLAAMRRRALTAALALALAGHVPGRLAWRALSRGTASSPSICTAS